MSFLASSRNLANFLFIFLVITVTTFMGYQLYFQSSSKMCQVPHSEMLETDDASGGDKRQPCSMPPLPLCPDVTLNLTGPLEVNFEAPTFEEIARNNPDVSVGGHFRPKDCIPRHGPVVVIIPYRDREVHLRALLHHLHPILQRQLLDYRIVVAEQEGNSTFNKGLLMNAGFKESLKLADQDCFETQIQCFIFHDVDLFLEDDRGFYICRELPFHLSEFIDKFDYKAWWGIDILVGGVTSIPRRFFELANGYSNVFFGWGGEDDEMRYRFASRNVPILRPDDSQFYRYKMLSHYVDESNPRNMLRFDLLANTTQRMDSDGLNSLTYELVQNSELPLYTHFLIKFDEKKVIMASLGRESLQ